MLAGELISCVISLTAYLRTFQPGAGTVSPRQSGVQSGSSGKAEAQSSLLILRQLLGLSVPLSLNRLLVNVLQSIEAVSIPASLRSFGYSSQAALSIYGVLTGMALSLVLFPSAFTGSASVLLLPLVSEAQSRQNESRIKDIILRAISLCMLLGSLCTLGFLLLGKPAGELLFGSSLAGTFICRLSVLCPFLYLHTTLASILNGLKKTGYTLMINILSLLIRLGFTLFAVPQVGISGYILGLFLSELISALLCVWGLRRYYR
jgi:stage V sporulation protein B